MEATVKARCWVISAVNFLAFFVIFAGTQSAIAQEPATQAAPPSETQFSAPSGPQLPSKQASWEAFIIRQGEQIEFLEVIGNRLPVILVERKGLFRPLAEVRLRLTRPGWTVSLATGRPLRSGTQPGEFFALVYLNSRLNELNLKVTPEGSGGSASGSVQTERILIFAPEAQEFKVMSNWEHLVLSVGIADIAYEQSTYGKFTSQAALLSARYMPTEFRKKFGLLAKADFTFFNLNPSPESANPNIVSLEPDITYRVDSFERPNWRVWLTGGISYLHMLTQEKSFGISHLAAPSIGARAQFFKGEKDTYLFTLRYTPLGQKLSFDEMLDQRGLGLGFRMDRILPNQKRLEASFELLHDTYMTSTSTEISLRLFSVRLGMSL